MSLLFGVAPILVAGPGVDGSTVSTWGASDTEQVNLYEIIQ